MIKVYPNLVLKEDQGVLKASREGSTHQLNQEEWTNILLHHLTVQRGSMDRLKETSSLRLRAKTSL
tara:strand:+ start:83 stop:280 length:198 start_codon:yes stop_codon:yes gene_type:complete